MASVKYSQEHEWISVDGDLGTIGITPYAQEQLGDVVFVELPTVGAKFDKGAAAAVVESVKAASDIYAPVSGEVVAVNDPVQKQTTLINEDAQGRGWLFQLKLTVPGEVDGLMDEAGYAEYLKTIA